MLNSPWYDALDAATPLTQGDIILGCPLLTWNAAATLSADPQGMEVLTQAASVFRADVVVMTQACDLEHAKVRNVVVCPHVSLTTFRAMWDRTLHQFGQNPTAKAWKNMCDDIAGGHVWNHAFLNSADGVDPPISSEIRVVDFHDIYTVPRAVLESLLEQRKTPRLRLLPPYREHLSQAFARFFMRVGLSEPLTKTW